MALKTATVKNPSGSRFMDDAYVPDPIPSLAVRRAEKCLARPFLSKQGADDLQRLLGP